MAQDQPSNYTMSFIDWVSWLKTSRRGMLRLDDDVLQYAPESVKGNKAIVLELVAKNGLILKHASETLRYDWDVVLEAVSQNWKALEVDECEYVNAWDQDGTLALVAVRQSWQAFWLLLPQQRGIKEVVLEAVIQNWQLLGHVLPRHKDDEDIVSAAVRQDWRSLWYASSGCRDREHIVLEAVSQSWKALPYASLRLRVNGDILGAARANGNPHGEMHMETKIQQIIGEAVQKNWRILSSACEEVRGNREIIHSALQTQWMALQFASAALRADRDLVLEAVQQNGHALRFANENLRNDRQVVLVSLKHDAQTLQWAGQTMRLDREVVLEAVRQDGTALQFAHADLRADRDVVVEAVNRAGEAVNFAEGPLVEDQDLALLAARVLKDRGRQSARPWPRHHWVAVAFEEKAFQKALLSAVAVRGEIAPVVVVNCLSRHESYKVFQCEASLMSGASFVCHIEDGWLDPMVLRRCRPSLQELAAKLVHEVRKHTEVRGLKRVFISIPAGVSVTPWDCDRPLTDFLTTSVGSGRQLILPESGTSDLSEVTLRAMGSQRPMLLHAEMCFRCLRASLKMLSRFLNASLKMLFRFGKETSKASIRLAAATFKMFYSLVEASFKVVLPIVEANPTLSACLAFVFVIRALSPTPGPP